MTTFLGLPSVEPAALTTGDADAVILGVPFGVPYPTPGPAAGCAEAPAAIRARSQRLARFAAHHDFDLDGPMLPPGSSNASKNSIGPFVTKLRPWRSPR